MTKVSATCPDVDVEVGGGLHTEDDRWCMACCAAIVGSKSDCVCSS